MPPQGGSSLGVLGWVILLTKAATIALGLFVQAVVELVRGHRAGVTFRQYIGYAGVRDFQRGLDAVGIQNLLPSTSKTCIKFAKKHGLERTELRLSDATVAQWLGSRKARKVIVYFHGGGYMSPALNEHLSLIFGFEQTRKDVSAVFLQYDLASEHANHYPRQLQQAVSLLDHLLYAAQVSPSSIILIGDSAGAHLLLSLLIHICHSNPAVPPLTVKGHFSGAVMISPWINLTSSAGSMLSDNDTLTVDALKYWARNFLGSAALDLWNSPWMAPNEYLGRLPVEETLVLYGDRELLRDDTLAFCERLIKYHPRSRAMAFPNEVHSHMILNRFLKTNQFSKSETVFNDWMNDHLRP